MIRGQISIMTNPLSVRTKALYTKIILRLNKAVDKIKSSTISLISLFVNFSLFFVPKERVKLKTSFKNTLTLYPSS